MTALDYYEAITVIEAQDNLVQMNVLDYSKRMNASGRSSFYREMRRKAYPRELQREISFEEFAKRTGMING